MQWWLMPDVNLVCPPACNGQLARGEAYQQADDIERRAVASA
jgi:hypothetical protein